MEIDNYIKKNKKNLSSNIKFNINDNLLYLVEYKNIFYKIKNKKHRICKIGYTSNWEKRKKSLEYDMKKFNCIKNIKNNKLIMKKNISINLLGLKRIINEVDEKNIHTHLKKKYPFLPIKDITANQIKKTELYKLHINIIDFFMKIKNKKSIENLEKENFNLKKKIKKLLFVKNKFILRTNKYNLRTKK